MKFRLFFFIEAVFFFLGFVGQAAPIIGTFNEGFETPDVAYGTWATKGTPPSNWVPTTTDSGFGWDKYGLYDEGDGSLFTTSFGDQVLKLDYNGNSGYTTKEGVITPSGILPYSKYSVSVNVGTSEASGRYTIRLIAFDGTANTLRDDVQLPIGGATYTVLDTISGVTALDDMSLQVSTTWELLDDPSVVGQDFAVQLVGDGGGPIYDNVSVVVSLPEPSTIILAGLGLMGLTFRRRRR